MQKSFDKVIVTNSITLSSQEKPKWLQVVDISKYFAKVIGALSASESISSLLRDVE